MNPVQRSFAQAQHQRTAFLQANIGGAREQIARGPAAIAPMVPAEHGTTTMPSTRVLPEAMIAPTSLFGRNSIFVAAVPVSIDGASWVRTEPRQVRSQAAASLFPSRPDTRAPRADRRRACAEPPAHRSPRSRPVMPTVMLLPAELAIAIAQILALVAPAGIVSRKIHPRSYFLKILTRSRTPIRNPIRLSCVQPSES